MGRVVSARTWAALAGGCAAAMGAAALVGWAVGSAGLAALQSGAIPMAPNTALGFVLLGIATAILEVLPERRRATWPVVAGAALAGLGLVRVFELLGGAPWGSDFWLIRPDPALLARWAAAGGGAPVGRMSLATAAGFVLAGTALAARGTARPEARAVSGLLATGLVGLGFVFVLGYLNKAPLLYGSDIIPMALNTALAFLLAGGGLIAAAGPTAPPLSPLAGPSTRSRLLRTFMPVTLAAVFAVPLLSGLATRLTGPGTAAVTEGTLAVLFGLLAAAASLRAAVFAERQLNLAEGALRQSQKMEALGRLAGGVAHDFNNLLSVIQGYAEMVSEAPSLDPKSRERIRTIQSAADRAGALTAQLLHFSRRSASTAPGRVDVRQDIEATLGMLIRLVGEQIRLEVRVADDARPVRLGAGQLDQILMNLIINARDAMPAGGTITLRAANVDLDPDAAWGGSAIPPGRYVEIEVADTGSGMTDEVQAHLFEPFFTTKAAGKGTGLGLATVHQIVTQGGGRITVASRVGEGTRFAILFPADPSAEVPAAPSRTGHQPRGRGETILVVDDEEPVRLLLAEVLSREGYQVAQAADGRQALEVCGGPTPVRLVLTDSVLPSGSGPELARQLQALRPDLRVILMSGRSAAEVLERVSDFRYAAFLQKPFPMDVLLKTVREVLDAAASEATARR